MIHKAVLTLIAFGWLALICIQQQQVDAARPQLEQVNIEEVLSNDRVLTNYIKCLLGKASCTREGRELKRILPDILQTDCSKCNPLQKRNSKKIITFLRTRRPQDWKKLTDKYDPEGLHKSRLE